MKILHDWWRKILYLIVTGTTSLFIAACYGPPIGYFKEWVIRMRDTDDNPIEGLEVSLLRYEPDTQTSPDTLEYRITGETGEAAFIVEGEYRYEAYVHDSDGNENGGRFADTLIVRGNEDESDVRLRREQ